MNARVDPDLRAMMARVLAAQRERPADRGDDVLAALDAVGLARLTGSPDRGGSGGTWSDAAELLRIAAYEGVPLPVVEHDLLAGWLLESAGLPADDRRRSAAVLDADGRARGVGWADRAQRITVVHRGADGWAVADVDRTDVAVTPRTGRSGEPRDDLVVAPATLATVGVPVAADVAEEFYLRGALARAAAIRGACERILDEVVEHVQTRQQFGRPLSRFQSVQHAVADLAAEVALAQAAVEAAVDSAAQTTVRTTLRAGTSAHAFRVAVARSVTGHAASVVVRTGHQLLGAIGTTREHRLHEFTRPALAWRSEFGTVLDWDRAVAAAARDAGPRRLWPLITG